jgi:hypothetical protein
MHTRIVGQAWMSGLLLVGSALIAVSCAGTETDDSDQTGSIESLPLAVTAGTTTTYEAEVLTRTASAIGSQIASEAGASGGKYVQFNGTAAVGAWIEFTLPNVAAGTYDLKLLYKSNNNRGIVQASIDGVNQGSPCNQYAATAAYKVACSLGNKTLTAGNHKIRFTVTGKSSSSSGYQMTVDQLALTASGTAGPCDIYAAANTPCVAAYSMIRVLSSTYTGPLYQVRKGGGTKNTGTGGTTQDIAAKDGFADSAAQDAFCGTDTCSVSKLYDQSGKGNALTVAKKGCYAGTASEDDYESNAKARSLTVGGHRVYALYTNPHEGYRNNTGAGMPVGTAAQGIYEIADGKRAGTACCWDFGNATKDNCYGATGSMDTIFFGTGYWGKGSGSGPWFMGDFEGGVWAGGSGASNTVNPNNPSMSIDYAFGILKSRAGNYAIRTGNAQSGSLTTAYDGAAPATWQLKGGIVLGIASDNSNSSYGTFFEGAITAGRPSDATDAAVLSNVQAAGYGK